MKHSMIPAFQRYELPGVLYSNQRLILNLQERILTLVEDAEGLSAQAYLSAQVQAVTQALFYPGVLDVALRGLDAALVDCRAKLAAFNLGMQPVPEEEGYRLFRLSL